MLLWCIPRSARGPRRPWDGSTSHKITLHVTSSNDPPGILQDAWGGPVLPGLGGQWGAQPLQGPRCCQPGRASLGELGSVAKLQRGVRVPLCPRSLPGYFWLRTRQATCRSPPSCRWGRLFWARGDDRGGHARAAVLPSAPAPLLCRWESRALLLRLALGLFHPFCATVLSSQGQRLCNGDKAPVQGTQH